MMELRYMGFEQLRNARAFRFDVLAKGEVTRQAVVTADMALFLQHHVGIQDGPTLCAGKLTADLEREFEGDHVLTADDLRAYSDARASAEAKRIEARRMAGRRHVAPPAFENPRGRF
jgi:hypothetical protein